MEVHSNGSRCIKALHFEKTWGYLLPNDLVAIRFTSNSPPMVPLEAKFFLDQTLKS